MKWIFLSLLLGNAAYLGYYLLVVSDEGSAPVTMQSEAYPAIQLLSERQGRSDRELEVEDVLENPISLTAAGSPSGCSGLGPFEDVISGQNAAERFNAVGFAVDLRAVDVPSGEFDYRVVLPPLPSLQEAFRRLRELKSRNIDSYVISQGEDAQGISLGVFSTDVAAADQKQRLTDEGYDVLIKELRRVNRGYWLLGVAGLSFPADLLESVRAEYTTVNVTETVCLN